MAEVRIKKAVIREDLLSITNDYRKAIILNQFIYWSERVSDADKFIQKENEIAKNNGEEERGLFYGLIYKTAEELADEVMLGLSASQIRRYISDLVDMGYISKRNNPKYKWDRTLQYRVNLVNIAKDLKKNGYPLSDYRIEIPENEKYNAHECAINNEPMENQTQASEETIPENTTENNNIYYSIKNNNAFSEDKSSSKVDMYAYVPEKHEVDEPKKENRYISQDYTYEQLREHIRPVYEKSLKEKYGYTDKDIPIESMLDITVEFCKLYEQKTGHKHKVLSYSSYDRIADCFMNPPNKLSEDGCALDLETHLLMAEQYFITNYNKRGKFNGSVEKSFSHFMSGLIRDNLYWQTCV